MVDIVYTPTSKYSAENDTKVSKDSFMYGVINYGTRVVVSDSVTNTTKNLYTVPVGKVAYLFQCNLSSRSASGAETASVTVGTVIILINVHAGAVSNALNSNLAYVTPMVLRNKETLNFSTNSIGTVAYASCFLYEVSETLIPLFY